MFEIFEYFFKYKKYLKYGILSNSWIWFEEEILLKSLD